LLGFIREKLGINNLMSRVDALEKNRENIADTERRLNLRIDQALEDESQRVHQKIVEGLQRA